MPDERWGPVDVEVVALPAERRERPPLRWPSPPSLGPRARLVLLGGALALLALVVLVAARDAPDRYPAGTPVPADGRFGVVVPGSVALLADDVADPDGGPRWGLRTFATTRGYGCLQVGRVQDGRLGVLALAGSGASSLEPDRFHPLPAAPAAQATTCVPRDGAGAAFVATHAVLTIAGTPAACWYASAGATRLRCPAATTRTVDAGLLGPRARAVTARVDGRVVTLPVRGRGRAGAYLVVQRPVRPATVGQTLSGKTYALPNEAPLAQTPASNVIASIAYAGAPACTTHPTLNPRGSCWPAPGFAPIPQPATGTTRAPVAAEPGRSGATVRFTAPLAAPDGRADYRATVDGRDAFPLATTTVAAGAPVERFLPLAPGRHRIVVRYRTRPALPRTGGGLDSPGHLVGHASVRIAPPR